MMTSHSANDIGLNAAAGKGGRLAAGGGGDRESDAESWEAAGVYDFTASDDFGNFEARRFLKLATCAKFLLSDRVLVSALLHGNLPERFALPMTCDHHRRLCWRQSTQCLQERL